jgi:hypothetical protein
MSDIEDTLKKLESKIAQLSEQLRDTKERRMFFNGLIMGLLLGIIGNILISYWMEYLKALGMPSWGWSLGLISVLVVVSCLIWWLDRESKR